MEVDVDSIYEEEPIDYQDIAGRNLYSAILLSAITDLNRFKILWTLSPYYHHTALLNGHQARRWMTRKGSIATVSFETCLNVLGLKRKVFIEQLEKQGLLKLEPDAKPLLNYYELDPDPKTLPKRSEHLSRTYEGLPNLEPHQNLPIPSSSRLILHTSGYLHGP